jgi:hypothetical protein
MTDWVSIANSAVAPKAPVTSELVTALRDNTVVSTWEFYDTVYDYTLDGGVGVITTPNFEDGWEYGFRLLDLKQSSGDRIFVVGAYDETNNEWSGQTLHQFSRPAETKFGGNSFLPIVLPRVPAVQFNAPDVQDENDEGISNWDQAFRALKFPSGVSTKDKVIRNLRWYWWNGTGSVNSTATTVNFTGGTILMYRRKENISDA